MYTLWFLTLKERGCVKLKLIDNEKRAYSINILTLVLIWLFCVYTYIFMILKCEKNTGDKCLESVIM